MNALTRRKYTYAVILIAAFALLCCFITSVNAESLIPPSNGMDGSGATYEISEDDSYVIITGYNDVMPNLTIPSEIEGLPVTEIAKNAFTNKVTLYSVEIPDTVVRIGEDAFRECRSLVSVKLPAGLKDLPMNCFFGCTVLRDVTLPNGLEKIDDFCFEGCVTLGRLKIPASVTEIGYDVFVHCENIFLDVSENSYAAEYAERYNVNTDYAGTSAYFWTAIGFSVAIALIIFFIISMVYMGYLKKHPEKNPNIFIFRALGKIYDALARGAELLKKGIAWLIVHVICAVSATLKWIKATLNEMKKRRSEKKKGSSEAEKEE